MGGRRPTAEALRPIIKVTSKKITVEIEISTKSYKMKNRCDAQSKNHYQIILCCKNAKILSTLKGKWGLLYINETRSLWLNVIYVQQPGVYTAVWWSFLCYCTLGYASTPVSFQRIHKDCWTFVKANTKHCQAHETWLEYHCFQIQTRNIISRLEMDCGSNDQSMRCQNSHHTEL